MNTKKLLLFTCIVVSGYFALNFAEFQDQDIEEITSALNTNNFSHPLSNQPITTSAPRLHDKVIISSQPENSKPKRKTTVSKNPQDRPLFKEGELLIKFSKDASENEIVALHARLGSTVIKKLKRRRIFNIKLRPGLPIAEAMKAYRESNLVQSVDTNNIRYPLTPDPTDSSYPLQWNMTIIQAPEAWKISSGIHKTIVAVIDTGVDYTHPDLAANIWTNLAELNGITDVDDDNNGYVDDIHGWDFGDNDTDTTDAGNHGTHIAGIIGAIGNNSLGVAGINWHVQIMPLKVQSDQIEGFTTSAIIDAIDYAIDMGAQIVNCSYGGTQRDTFEYQAMVDLNNADILAICAAGNGIGGIGIDNDKDPEYPASFDLDNIIAVSASDSNDSLTSYSNYGLISVDLAAPGEGIFSTIPKVSFVLLNTTPPMEYEARSLEYAGITDSNDIGITGKIIDCSYGALPSDFPTNVQNNIALIARDIVPRITTFSTKVNNAQKAGALGVIIYDDNVSAILPFAHGTLGTADTWIPTIAVTYATGQILNTIAPTQTITLVNTSNTAPSHYNFLSGTSMAAPHVSGAASLLYALNPKLSSQEIKTIILNSVDKSPGFAGKSVSGGRLNLFETLKKAFLPGDINGDNVVSLVDAILILQMISDQTAEVSSVSPITNAEINGDNQFGMAEIIFILHKTAEL